MKLAFALALLAAQVVTGQPSRLELAPGTKYDARIPTLAQVAGRTTICST